MRALKQPATIIATIALFVALGGTAAVASGIINGSQIKNHSIPASKLTKSAIASLHGQQGPKGDTGAKGDTGSAGAPGTARAWAVVGYNAAIQSQHNVTSITHSGDGDYCVHLDSSINASTAAADLTPFYSSDNTGPNSAVVSHVEFEDPCSSNGLEVYTFRIDLGAATLTQADEGFVIVVP